MHKRWDPAFTVVELIISIVVVVILITITIVAYHGVTKLTLSTAANSDLQQLATAMQRDLQKTGEYPATSPVEFKASENVNTEIIRSGALPYYTNLSTVQGGMLIAKICQDLVDEGYGKGTSQSGQLRDYITGCGNWNHDSMQITGWDSKVWNTPVEKQPLIDYAANFTAPAWDIDQERVMEAFYGALVSRYEQMGGTFPVQSFWDYWATPGNGGVMEQPLDSSAPVKPYYCAEATVNKYPELKWHVTHKAKVEAGSC